MGVYCVSNPDALNHKMQVMDDLGFTDTSYLSNYQSGNDYSFSTPAIERLSSNSNSIRLNYHYSEPICSGWNIISFSLNR